MVLGIPARHVIVILIFIAAAICYIERIGFPVAYTEVALRAGIDQATKGYVLSAFYYGYATSQVAGSWAAQRYGGRIVLTLSFLLWFLLCVLTPSQPGSTQYLLVLLRLVSGAAQGFIFPAMHTFLAQWVPPNEKSRAVSLAMSGMYFGAAVAMVIVPTMVENFGPESVFQLVAVTGTAWTFLWVIFSSDPPGGPTAFAYEVDGSKKKEDEADGSGAVAADAPVRELRRRREEQSPEIRGRDGPKGEGKKEEGKKEGKKLQQQEAKREIPWGGMLVSGAVWALMINNFTFHYALYVLMNWLPTYFEQGLKASLTSVGSGKSAPYFIMFLFSNVGGVLADYFITRHILSIGATRKVLNTIGFVGAAAALALTPVLASVNGVILCSSITLGACALSRAGFGVNHMDIAPRFAGIVMGIANTAGTFAGVVGVAATGLILQAFGVGQGGEEVTETEAMGWWWVFMSPALLCIFSALMFLVYSTGERIFD